MKLYSVIRFGNDDEGPDGEDTEFLVLADSVQSAAGLVDNQLKNMPHEKVDNICHAIAIIGESFSERTEGVILSGPNLIRVSLLGIGIPEENIWRRDEDEPGSVWVLLEDY